MKHFIVILLASCLISLYGCNSTQQHNINDENTIGIIETKNDSEESRILFYDENLNLQSELDIEYASVNSIFYNPVIKNDSLFLIPKGVINKKTNKEIIELCLNTAETTSYSINQPAINSVAVNDEYLFTCNTLNDITYISRYTFDSDEIKLIQIKNQYVSFITVSNNKLYAFSSTMDNKYSTISCFDSDLNFLFETDCTELGTGVYQSAEYNEYLYFSVLYPYNSKTSNQIGRLNTETNEFEIISTEVDKPFGLQRYENTLVITHYDIVNRANTSSISLVNLETNKITTHSFNHGAEQVTVVNGKIYVLSKEKIYCYSLDDWSLLKTTEIKKENQDFSYITGIFAV